MPSFLSKVFGRKKQDGKEPTRSSRRSSDPSLLEGIKFEAVPPTVSPTASHFPEKGKDKDKDPAFGLFRSRSRVHSPLPGPSKPLSNGYHLTLNLSPAKEEKSRLAFEPESSQTLPDDVLNERRLSPSETLSLIDACAKAITERGGLETLGVMHPHWYSATPAIQRKLISLYILSLAPNTPLITLSPNSDSPTSLFDSELRYTRSSHDIAAVLRWGLRHLKLEGNSFGINEDSSSDELQWYHTFQQAETSASYPSNAFSDKLASRVPEAHLKLLISTLDTISSFASHAEANGMSGSKLSKFLGLWLLSASRSEHTDDWHSFYTRWEKAGRMLEHLFLSWIRDESSKHHMPTRLIELVDHYPYSTTLLDDGLLPRPRFSTRRYDALFIHIETTVPNSTSIDFRQHPARIIIDALKSDTTAEPGVVVQLWAELKKHTGDPESVLSEVFSEDTVCLLSMVAPDPNAPEAISLPSSPTRKRSMSVGAAPKDLHSRRAVTNEDTAVRADNKPSQTSPLSQPESPKDWAEFSSAGFGDSSISGNFASTLLDKDIEVTDPSTSRRPSKKLKLPPIGRSTRSSLDVPSSTIFPRTDDTSPAPTFVSKSTSVSLIELDEAFIDFWNDALLDPISHDWPQFVVGQLKKPLEMEEAKQVGWVVIEQTFTRPSAPPTRTPTASSTHGEKSSRPSGNRKVSPSPRPSLTSERMSSSLSAAVKRFSLFGGQDGKEGTKKDVGRKKGPKSPTIGELGEILSEEPEEEQKVGSENDKDHKAEIGGAALGGAAVVAGIAAVHEASSSEVASAPETVLLPEEDAQPASGFDQPEATVAVIPEVTPVVDATPESPGEVDLTELDPAETQEDPLHPAPEPAAVVASADAPDEVDLTDVEPSLEQQDEALPPAPEAVVHSGETPGPQLALDSVEVPTNESPEPAPTVATAQEPVADFEPPSSSPVAFEQLSSAVDEESSAGVDMEEVPIVDEVPQEPTTTADIPVIEPPHQESQNATPHKDPLPIEQPEESQSADETQPVEPEIVEDTHEEPRDEVTDHPVTIESTVSSSSPVPAAVVVEESPQEAMASVDAPVPFPLSEPEADEPVVEMQTTDLPQSSPATVAEPSVSEDLTASPPPPVEISEEVPATVINNSPPAVDLAPSVEHGDTAEPPTKMEDAAENTTNFQS